MPAAEAFGLADRAGVIAAALLVGTLVPAGCSGTVGPALTVVATAAEGLPVPPGEALGALFADGADASAYGSSVPLDADACLALAVPSGAALVIAALVIATLVPMGSTVPALAALGYAPAALPVPPALAPALVGAPPVTLTPSLVAARAVPAGLALALALPLAFAPAGGTIARTATIASDAATAATTSAAAHGRP